MTRDKSLAAEIAFAEVHGEVEKASLMYDQFASAHEGWAVIKEEMDELWDEVKVKQSKRDKTKLRAEAKQVAAMAIRFMMDCTS